MQKNPRISILIPVFNGERFAESTLDSVIAQSYEDWEIIAMDGGSKDRTSEIFRGYAAKYPNIHFYSEPDEGVWHAIYKAAQKAKGSLLAFLCVSDGYINKDWLKLVAAKFDEDKDVSLVWGIPYQMDEDDHVLGPNYIYAQFLEAPGSHRASFLRESWHKVAGIRPANLGSFLKKFRPENMRLAKTVLRGGKVPEKEDWFFYWLETGQFFPDLNMCLYREIFFECVPPYVLGHRVIDEYMTLYYNFNARGYLSYCLPIPANYGRVHRGQITEHVIKESDRLKKEYFDKIREFKKQLKERKSIMFYDRNRKLVSERKVI